jgi:hypothetical protein
MTFRRFAVHAIRVLCVGNLAMTIGLTPGVLAESPWWLLLWPALLAMNAWSVMRVFDVDSWRDLKCAVVVGLLMPPRAKADLDHLVALNGQGSVTFDWWCFRFRVTQRSPQ